jgi:hypothetical protein
MKIAKDIIAQLNEGLPKDLKIGKVYKKIVVDGETFRDMELTDINPTKAEVKFKSKKDNHTFNYVEQEVKFK